MRRTKWLALGLVLVLALSVLGLAGCGSSGSDSGSTGSSSTDGSSLSGSINQEGSDTIVNMANAWAENFMSENPDVMIAVKGGGSGNGIAALINGTTDIADASREMKDEERAQAQSNGVEPVETAIANDGIAVVVNPANSVTGLTKEQLGRIYRGEITNWKDVGGSDEGIVLLSRDSSSGTYEYFKEDVVGKDKNYAKQAKLLPSNQAIVDEVKGNDAAIGYIGLGYETDDVKVVQIDGVAASTETVLDGTYPISRQLYVYTNGDPEGVVKAYIDWILGPEGQQIVEDEGFVPLQK